MVDETIATDDRLAGEGIAVTHTCHPCTRRVELRHFARIAVLRRACCASCVALLDWLVYHRRNNINSNDRARPNTKQRSRTKNHRNTARDTTHHKKPQQVCAKICILICVSVHIREYVIWRCSRAGRISHRFFFGSGALAILYPLAPDICGRRRRRLRVQLFAKYKCNRRCPIGCVRLIRISYYLEEYHRHYSTYLSSVRGKNHLSTSSNGRPMLRPPQQRMHIVMIARRRRLQIVPIFAAGRRVRVAPDQRPVAASERRQQRLVRRTIEHREYAVDLRTASA